MTSSLTSWPSRRRRGPGMPCTHSSSTRDADRARGSRSRAAGPSARRGGRRRCAATSSSSRGGHARADAAGHLADRLGDDAARGAQGGELIRVVDGHPVILTHRMSSATFTRPSRGDVLELTIDSLAHGGNGVARLEGYVVFVAGGIPGDRVRAVVGKAKKAYAEARAIEIARALAGPRPASSPTIPGAPWQVLPYERQLEVKAEQVDDALRRIGRLDGFELEPIVPAVEQWRYRNKLEYSFGTGEDGELVCGFHAPGRWNEIVADGRLQARLRARATSCASRCCAFCREQGLRRVGPARPPRLPAQPRRPRGPPHRPDPGAADHLARQARRRRADRRRRRRRPVVDADRRPRREHLRRRDDAARPAPRS